MKKVYLLFVLASSLVLFSCSKEEQGETEEVAVPVTMTIADFRASVEIEAPGEIEQSGKIYVYKDYIFVNDHSKGVFVLDNRNYNPVKLKFLKIPLNTDIAIKDDVLFANSGRDLVTFDISDINNIKQKERLEDVFPHYWPEIPSEAAYADYSPVNLNENIIVGYKLETRKKVNRGEIGRLESSFDGVSTTGTGGSMARFNIGGDYLYSVGQSELNVFDITNLSNPQKIGEEYVGWQIETIFNTEGHLYLGSATGMYIYNLNDPSNPKFMSQISHVMGCDPVVVTNDIAYVTIRGGNLCGQNENQLEIIDVSDKQNPQLLKIYQMDSPYGVGVWQDKLFVCDGDSGLKVYDASNTPELVLEDHFKDLHAYDVIPLKDVLLLIGDNVLRQYSYKNNEVKPISTFNLN